MSTERERREQRARPPARRRDAEAALRESEERFRGAFDASAIGFAIVELDGRVREVNRSLCRMLGYDRSELLQRTLHELTHPGDLARSEALEHRLLAGEMDSFYREQRYVHKEGRIVCAVLTVSLVRGADGTSRYCVAQLADITARKDAERALERHAAELERSNAELEQFAYVASHDLREPLRAVASYAQLLAESYQGRLDARADRWIAYIAGGADRMQRLIRDLLMLARVRTDGGTFAPTDTTLVATRAWEQLQTQQPGAGGTLALHPLPTIDADALQFEQLFQNLLGNAMKYRRPAVSLEVEVSAERLEGDDGTAWLFTARDNGIGMDMAHAERVFEIFQRLHREDEYEGTGIGLAICRRIVERHGGRIWVESVPGEGTSFLFTLREHSR